jgi:hypothetical protein
LIFYTSFIFNTFQKGVNNKELKCFIALTLMH